MEKVRESVFESPLQVRAVPSNRIGIADIAQAAQLPVAHIAERAWSGRTVGAGPSEVVEAPGFAPALAEDTEPAAGLRPVPDIPVGLLDRSPRRRPSNRSIFAERL